VNPLQPYRPLVFLIACLASLSLVIWLFPSQGVQITDEYKLEFLTFNDLFGKDTIEQVDISAILDVTVDTSAADVLEVVDTAALRARADSIRRTQLMIHYPEGDKSILYSFFKSLEAGGKRRRILHYGDSQIEGDRITAYVRNEMQKRFGGTGAGMVQAVDIVRRLAVEQAASENMKRYTVFGKRDTLVKHNRYGIMATFVRYSPVPDTTISDTVQHEAWMSIKPSRLGYAKSRQYNDIKLYFGHHRRPLSITAYNGEELVRKDSLPATAGLVTLSYQFDKTPEELKLVFKGKDSPEIYGITLDGGSGIAMDNLAMRGSSGTIFGRMNHALMKQIYADLNVKLLILQYGGNVMPYLDDQEEAERYARWFGNQVRSLKNMIPGVSVIVIGPSDMSVKVKDRFVTYPMLPIVRNAMKAEAFKSGAAYWDLYEAMGGLNSMPAWVEAEPPLAASDYTHFTPKGVRQISEWFYHALLKDFKTYQSQK
jgi:lysophospholipase L1-like esterase